MRVIQLYISYVTLLCQWIMHTSGKSGSVYVGDITVRTFANTVVHGWQWIMHSNTTVPVMSYNCTR